MHVQVTQENLARALSDVSRVASNRASLPVLSNILLKTNNNRLVIAATNLDLAISETIGAKITTEGAITVPARLMQDFIGSLPAGNLELRVEESKLQLKAERFEATINGMSAEEFPVMPTIEAGSTIAIPADTLKQSLQQVLFAASSDESRPVLTGVLVHSMDKKLVLAATDSYRLAEKTTDQVADDVSLLLPARSLHELLRSLRDGTESVSITYDEQQARFSVDTIELVTRLVDGTYPDYQKLLPKSFETTADVPLKELQEIVKVSSLFAREAAGSITMELSEATQQISIRSIASQVGENTAEATAKVTGNAVITMNSRYILDALQAFSGDMVSVRVNGKLDPCVLVDPKNNDYLHLVMPVKS